MENMEIKLTATAHPEGLIELETTGYGGWLHKQVINTQDKLVRDALMALGWTPPDERSVPSCPEPITESGLKKMMADPRYWRDRDPTIIQQVRDGFMKLYPDA